jgi:ligand-binding sensor domain-containing protein
MTWNHRVCNVFVARRGFVRTACLSISLIASIADRALALEPTQSANIYIGKNFTVEDGLLSNRVNAIVQTRDGFLWVGTEEADSGDGDSIQCLRFTLTGTLFVGTMTGLYRFDHDKFSVVIPKLWTSRIEEASNGHLLPRGGMPYKAYAPLR